MNFIELISKRRSVREYSNKPIDRKIIERCIEAARLAPSACNSQPWYFIVVDNELLKKQLTEAAFKGIYSMNRFVESTPALVVIIRGREKYTEKLGSYLRKTQYSLIDIGIACEHIALQAQEEGLGTCMIGWFNEKVLKDILGLPRKTKVDMLISIGYPKTINGGTKKRKSIEEIRKYL